MAEQENMSVMDFDAIQEKRTDELMQLLDAYRRGIIKEKK